MNQTAHAHPTDSVRGGHPIRSLLVAAALLATWPIQAKAPQPDPIQVMEPMHLAAGYFNRGQGLGYLAVIRLGKALFWDRQLSADGQTACASCHLHAGADPRSLNQANPGQWRSTSNLLAPLEDTGFQAIGPNQRWRRTDFPLRQLADPGNRASAVVRSTNEVVGSQGSYAAQQSGGMVLPAASPVFQAHGLATLQVTPRQAPSVINAGVNVRQGWDGRSQPLFNGADGRGPFASFPDSRGRWAPGSVVRYNKEYWANPQGSSPGRWDVKVQEARALVPRSSLASHAVDALLDETKMSAKGRTLRDVASRVLPAKPLAWQQVSPNDSVLGPLAAPAGKGLRSPDYTSLFKEAFAEWWWSSEGEPLQYKAPRGRDTWAGNPPGIVDIEESAQFSAFSRSASSTTRRVTDPRPDLLEANFGLLAGLAIQTYLNTLVSNDSPYDRHLAGTAVLSDQARRGMALFNGKAGCAACHSGPEFTSASIANIEGASGAVGLVTMSDGKRAAVDTGFAYTGVTAAAEDAGLGRQSPHLSARPYAELAHTLDGGAFVAHTGLRNPLGKPSAPALTAGAMKIPSLRNVALTAPYFHNGDSRTLAEVVQFYNRGGNMSLSHAALVPQQIRPLGLSEIEQAQLVSFLESLTDDRVWRHQAPFDHPEQLVPEGHVVSQGRPVPNATGLQAALEWQSWSAVGAAGYGQEQLPLPFLGGLIPDRQRVWIRTADGQQCLTMFLGFAASWLPCSPLLPNQVFNVVQSTSLNGAGRSTRFQLRSAVTGWWLSTPSEPLPAGRRTTLRLSINLDQDSDVMVQELPRGGVRLVWPKHGGCLSVVPGASPGFIACAETEGPLLESQRFQIVSAGS